MADYRTERDVDSLRLSTTLDLFGLSHEMIAFRVACCKKQQTVHTFMRPIENLELFFTGSQADGTTMSIMQSDHDIMNVPGADNYRVISDRNDIYALKKKYRNVLLLSTYNVHSGFAKLQELSTTDEKGHMKTCRFLSSSQMHFAGFEGGGRTRHGPCMEMTKKDNYPPTDSLNYCIQCPFWPDQAREWLERKREFNWPTAQQLQAGAKQGCMLVPIGFPGSSTEDIEWRLSFSLLERDLIWTWNNTHLKCIVLLKLIKKAVIDPILPDVLSTYHLKTLMFWAIEETNVDIWTTENLAVRIMDLVKKLCQWVKAGKCPQYFVRDNNLFESKVHGVSQKKLVAILDNVCAEGFKSCLQYYDILYKVFNCDPPSYIGQKYFSKTIAYSDMYSNVFLEVIKERRHLYQTLHCKTFILYTANMLGEVLSLHERLGEVLSLHEQLEKANEAAMKNMRVWDRALFRLMLRPVQTSLGYHLLATALRTEEQQSREALLAKALYKLEAGQQYDQMSGKLKLATFHYMVGNYTGTLEMINNLLHIYNNENNPIHISASSAWVDIGYKHLHHLAKLRAHLLPLRSLIGNKFVLEVVFLPFEIFSVPKLFRYEFRNVKFGMEITQDDPIEGQWGVAVVDSVVFAYFLQFLCYHHLNEEINRKRTLGRFRQYMEDKLVDVRHRCSALNLFAQCCYVVGDVQLAFESLTKSMMVESSYAFNAAPIILGVIICDFVHGRSSPHLPSEPSDCTARLSDLADFFKSNINSLPPQYPNRPTESYGLFVDDLAWDNFVKSTAL